jgi:hypothetical protein
MSSYNINSITDQFNSKKVTITNLEKDSYNTLGTFSKTTLINLEPVFGFNTIRNKSDIVGSGSVLNNNSEYKLSVSLKDDVAGLVSREYGSYVAGKTCECGIAIRIPVPLVGNQVLTWGYYDSDNGIYFKKTSNNFYVCIKRNGIETAIQQSNFNRDKMNKTSGHSDNINFAKGNVFHINFNWYGYGPIDFSVVGLDFFNTYKPCQLHSYQTIYQTSTGNPMLPISVHLTNDTTLDVNTEIFVAGRQFSVMGTLSNHNRCNGEYIINKQVSQTLTPVLSLDKKSNFNCNTFLGSISAKASLNTYIEIRKLTTPTNANFLEIENAESCMKCDKVADSVTDGIVIWSGILPENTAFFMDLSKNSICFNKLSILAKSLSVNTSDILFLHFNWIEKF